MTKSSLTLCGPMTAAFQAPLSFTISRNLLRFMSESVMLSNHLILFPTLLLLPSIFPRVKVFSNEPGGQSIGASASASVLPMSIQSWFPLGLTGLISFLSKGLSRVFSSTTIWKHQIFNIFMKQKTKQTKPKTKDILIKDETRENYFEHEIYISKKK